MFDPSAHTAPADPVKRVLLAVLDIIGGSNPWDSEVLYQVISDAMRPKSQTDRELMEGTGPLTYQQFRGLMERVQGWKGDWLRDTAAIAQELTMRNVKFRGAAVDVLRKLLQRFEERPDHIIIRVPVHQAGDVTSISLKGWTITLNPEELAALRIEGVREK